MFVAFADRSSVKRYDTSLTLAEERTLAEKLGLQYHHLPISLDKLDAAQVKELREILHGSQGPVFVHCGMGQRACSFSLAASGIDADSIFIPMEIGKINGGKSGFNVWTINGEPYDQSEPIKIHQGRRYQLAFVNKSDDMHPVHLHRQNFEITKIHGKETSGIFKDTVLTRASAELMSIL